MPINRDDREIHESSDLKVQEILQDLTDGLLMPTGELGAALVAAIIIAIFLWKTSGVT
jgi:hypothetical protein